MDAASSLGSFIAFANNPCSYLVWSCCEEINQMDHVEGRGYHLVHRASCSVLFQLLRPCSIRLQILKFLLIGAAVGDDGASRSVRLNPLKNWLQELVLFSAIILLRQIYSKHARLRSEKRIVVQVFNIVGIPICHVILNVL